MTYTLNGYFGAMEIAGNTGVLLNDEMNDFTSKPGVPNMYGLVQGCANEIAPGKRLLSSMAPTLVIRNGHVFLVLGSPGGSRIITITLETLMNVIDYGMDPRAAVDAPRFHEQGLPDRIDVEPFALSPDTAKLLRGMGGLTIARSVPAAAAPAPPLTLIASVRSLEVNGRAARQFRLAGPGGISGLRIAPGQNFNVDLVNEAGVPTIIHWHGQTPPLDAGWLSLAANAADPARHAPPL